MDFKDFVPSVKDPGGFFKPATHEDLAETLARANAWIDQKGIDVINVETVVLPNMRIEEGPEDTELRTSGDMSSYWYQFIRVWFRGRD